MEPTREELARSRDEVIEIVFRKGYRPGNAKSPSL